MTTERMTELDKALGSLGFTHDVSAARNELATLRRVEQEQAAEIALLKQSQEAQKHVIAELREQIARLTQERTEWQDATGCTSPRQADEHVKALHSKADTANECARLANDKMAEQVRQARLDVILEVRTRAPTVGNARLNALWDWLDGMLDANAPKD